MTTNHGLPGSPDQPEERWRCTTCGSEYVRDVGRCGNLQPPCDGTVTRVRTGLLDAVRGTVDAVQSIAALMANGTPKPDLGLTWRIVIEKDGKPAAEVRRTIDEGITVGFYGDYTEVEDA